jgi:hypothetical protein
MTIKLITNPHPFSTLQARQDFAEVAGVEMYENPWWYKYVETGRTYYDLVACLGWPDEVTAEKGEGQPGYAAIVGIVRPADASKTGFSAEKANFHMIEEVQHSDVPTLLSLCDQLRRKYGFGINRDLLNVWYGDPDRFATALALRNEFLTRQGGEQNTIMVAPPDDYNLTNRFEIYLRALKSVIQTDNLRLYFSQCVILKNRCKEFKRNDPAVMAVGGLIHTLLGRTMWMGQREDDNAFNLKVVL